MTIAVTTSSGQLGQTTIRALQRPDGDHTIIAGIYDRIRAGGLDNASDYNAAAGPPYESWETYFAALHDINTLPLGSEC